MDFIVIVPAISPRVVLRWGDDIVSNGFLDMAVASKLKGKSVRWIQLCSKKVKSPGGNGGALTRSRGVC
jgi:hypothetical protein